MKNRRRSPAAVTTDDGALLADLSNPSDLNSSLSSCTPKSVRKAISNLSSQVQTGTSKIVEAAHKAEEVAGDTAKVAVKLASCPQVILQAGHRNISLT